MTKIARSLAALFLFALAAQVQATVVRVDTPLGTFYIDLFEDTAPNTVANFLSYLRDGDYDNTIIHRNVPGFVIQGGGFDLDGGEFGEVPEDSAIANEFGASNTRGTIAMARLSGQPDSATSQWFINAVDNASDLDGVDGGFTVFGEVIGDGMRIVDVINSLQRYNRASIQGAFGELPLLAFSGNGTPTEQNVIFTRFSEVEGFDINAGLAGAWFNAQTAGQGWLFDIIEQDGRAEVFVAWFTYDLNDAAADETDGFGSKQHRWFTGLAPYTGGISTIPISLSTGGVFNDPRDANSAPVGTLTVEFTSCTDGQISWDFDDEDVPDATVAITRLTPDAFCNTTGLPAGAQP